MTSSNLYVPNPKPPLLEVYLDETYLNRHSGFLQSALILPGSLYARELERRSREFLTQIQANTKEFKGTNLTRRNYPIYRSFLADYINVMNQLAVVSPFRSIVGIDAYDRYRSSAHIVNIETALDRSFTDIGLSCSTTLRKEFARLLYWLTWHLSGVVRQKIPECHFEFNFDNRHQLAKEADEFTMAQSSYHIGLFIKVREALRIAAHALLPKLVPELNNCRVVGINFIPSENNFAIQAADLFCHMVYNTIKELLGHTDPIVTLKAELLREFASTNLEDLRHHTTLVRQGGAVEVECTNPQLTTQLVLG